VSWAIAVGCTSGLMPRRRQHLLRAQPAAAPRWHAGPAAYRGV